MKNLEQLLLEKANPEVKQLIEEFRHAPWDYKIFGPMSLEDEPVVMVYLSIGKTRKMYDVVLSYDMGTGEVTNLEMETPKIRTLRA